jgi:sugar phosphate isomerase/epimerase
MGNYLHPNRAVSDIHIRDLEDVIELAAALSVRVVNGFAGCPGAAKDEKYPCWIGLPYPPEFQNYLKWQWEEKIIPFWKEIVLRLKKYKIKYAFEMHPGDAVYNTTTLIKLREAVNYEGMGCCFDPAHLFWQGMDPIECVKRLEGIIFNVHAQDSELNMKVVNVDGVLDPKDYSDLANRAWNLRLVGYGHGEEFWRKLILVLRSAGYDGPLSVEHQDALIGKNEGFKKAIEFLSRIIFREKPDKIIY